ncbi:MAG TPA: hypothetical protein VG271_19345 [Beijerinckiaceae bacterium]|jgi:hypothetical protein|nr:hypothetical protein [Beijerinckiaceae bacterium]
MIRHFIAAAFVGSVVALAPSLSEARQPMQFMAGVPTGKNVVLSFDQDSNGGIAALRIKTHLIGNPGAKLSIWVDRSASRLFSRILTTDDCKYGDDGARCRFVIDQRSPDYRRFVVAFKRGKTAHIEVQNAGVMEMRSNISLIGFTRALGRQS